MKPQNPTYLVIDFETRSKNDLPNTGAHNYARDPSTEVLTLAYRFSTWQAGRVDLWRAYKGEKFPAELKDYCGQIVAHNWSFEYEIIQAHVIKHLSARAKKCWKDPNNYDCTQAQAARWGLPLSLDGASKAINSKELKQASTGKNVLSAVGRLRKGGLIPVEEIPATVWDDLEKYNLQDVRATERLYTVLPPIEGRELEVFRLDQRMNARGFQVDRPAAEKVQAAYEKQTATAEKEAIALCGETATGNVLVRSSSGFKAWLNERLPKKQQVANVQAATIEKILERPETPEDVRRACQLRQILGATAAKKVNAFLGFSDPAGIARHQLQYYGAHTGRWSGRGIQPQNIARDCVDSAQFDKALKKFCGRSGDPLQAGALMRPLITARPGHVLAIRDYAQIEVRVLLWLAGHRKELEILGSGGDLYVAFAADSVFRKPTEKITKDDRFIGKTAVLGLGYGMGPAKFHGLLQTAGQNVKQAFSQKVVQIYRARFNRVTKFWRDCEKAFVSTKPVSVCLGGPETTIEFYTRGKSRRVRLPSGRELNYLNVRQQRSDWGTTETVYDGRRGRAYVWGGVVVENIVQAVSRDIMADAMLAFDKQRGIDVLLTVHDEIVLEIAERAKTAGTAAKIDKTAVNASAWAAGLPLAVEGEFSFRYGK